ncbi:hypothetical protein IQ254_16855 [Nodosilinea sp. LEGE 07088]|uniref:hypothetical protein n=1 Tax=Nodosilinea sp. LEGE 07088 TaxID=2777968 RepID=UPI001882CE27|nr:hypothetical protein [Nodosilinea sp. LEGE 07088]MBE9138844.1 hypothetical protein [Nodosilinea sp. LEGE 07088]
MSNFEEKKLEASVDWAALESQVSDELSDAGLNLISGGRGSAGIEIELGKEEVSNLIDFGAATGGPASMLAKFWKSRDGEPGLVNGPNVLRDVGKVNIKFGT